METIEQNRIRQRFSRALSTYREHAVAQQRISKYLASLLLVYTHASFKRVLEIGCGNGGFTRELKRYARIEKWEVNDLCGDCFPAIQSLFPNVSPTFWAGDAASLSFSGSYDLIASASAFQWMEDLPSFLRKLAVLLEPSGVLLFNTFTAGNLKEIKQLTGKGLVYPTQQQIRSWLEPSFEILHEEENSIPLSFPSPMDVLRHLKYTGVTATADGTAWTRGRQEAFCNRYRQLFATETKEVILTYQPLYVLAVKK